MFATSPRPVRPGDPPGDTPGPVTSPTGATSTLWSRIHRLAGELAALDCRGWNRRDLVGALETLGVLEGAVSAAQAAVTAAVDALADRGAGATQVLTSVSGCSEREARRRHRRARSLPEMPNTTGLLGAGRLSPEGADLLVDAARRVSPRAVDTDPSLLDQVARRPADAARRIVDAWVRRRQNATDADERLRHQRHDRRAHWWVDRHDGMHHIRVTLDPVTAASVTAVLDTETDRLWRSDGGRDGRPDEVRTPEQRRADAFTRCLGVSAPGPDTDPAPPGPGGTRATIVVVADLGVVDGTAPGGRCEIIDTGPVPPSVLTDLARRSDTTVCGALFDGPGRPLWLGRTRRLANAPQRLMMAVRDRGCVACAAPFAHTQAHHSTPHHRHGATDVDLLVSLCARCHTRAHTGRIRLHRRADGTWYASADPTEPDPDPP